MNAALPARATRATPRLRVGQWLALSIGVLLTFAVVGVGLALIANHRQTVQRHVVLDEVEPALLAALNLENALINEETGVRGFILSGDHRSLESYETGRAAERRAYVELEQRGALTGSTLVDDLQSVRARAQTWQLRFVEPTLRGGPTPHLRSVAPTLAGKRLFDAIRVSLSQLRGELTRRLASERRQLSIDAGFLEDVLLIAAGLVVGSVLGAGVLLRRIITRPLASLGAEAEHVAAGNFAKPVAINEGAREIVELSVGIDAMRQRIVQELATVEEARLRLESQALELQRSNAELEQFAYVASHDLQEPLRKIASFCQALERRYHGQLDARADQYIEFAVDGAKRMQTLINDLLAFSRVGRSGHKHQSVDLNDALAAAKSSLASAIAANDATVVADSLPVVLGEQSLLVSLFQNLIGNAIKFRGGDPPSVRVTVAREDDHWSFSCADNGIGVESEYADRIFVIFQRLHTKEAYPGTGIGLAMCRKIVEYHGGRMWLDPAHSPGAEFRFTLPIAKEQT